MTTISLRAAALLLGACLTAAALSVPAFAAGDGGSIMPTCAKGQIYDSRSGKCVKQQGAIIPDDQRAGYAYSLAKEGRYEEALAILDTIQNQNTAEVLNYRGYATRKLGRTDEGIAYYLRSVKLDPAYAEVREYLGEAYVIKGRLDLAREQLDIIAKICGTGCEEYEDLKEALASPSKL